MCEFVLKIARVVEVVEVSCVEVHILGVGGENTLRCESFHSATAKIYKTNNFLSSNISSNVVKL